MKRSTIFCSIVIITLALSSCSGTKSCANAEKYNPEDVTSTVYLEIAADTANFYG